MKLEVEMTEEQLEKRDRLAADVLRLSRNTLLVNLRFLVSNKTRLPMIGGLVLLFARPCRPGAQISFSMKTAL